MGVKVEQAHYLGADGGVGAVRLHERFALRLGLVEGREEMILGLSPQVRHFLPTFQLAAEPCPGMGPLILDRATGDAENGGTFVVGHSAEEAHFD